jgi:hypothetical protein
VSHSDTTPTSLRDGGSRVAGPSDAAPGVRSRWTAGPVAALTIGTLLALLAVTLVGAAATALWADRAQRDGGYVTTDRHQLSTRGSALVTEETKLGVAGVGWLYGPSVLGTVRIRVTPQTPDSRLFVGIAHAADADRYLAGVKRTRITEFFADKTEQLDGGAASSAPDTHPFWVASVTGAGPQTLLWKPRTGSWTVVVMNADAHPGLNVRADLGARFGVLPWIALGVLIAGAVFAAAAGLLITRAIRDLRDHRTATT